MHLMACFPCHPGDTCQGISSAALASPCSSMAAAAGSLTARHPVRRPLAATRAHGHSHRQLCSPQEYLDCTKRDAKTCLLCKHSNSIRMYTLPCMHHRTLAMETSGVVLLVSGQSQEVLLQHLYLSGSGLSIVHVGMLAEEGEDLPDLGIPRRQRGTRRRLNFDRVTREPVFERPRSIERHTSGIYDLIDAIGLLGRQQPSLSAAKIPVESGPGCSEGVLELHCGCEGH